MAKAGRSVLLMTIVAVVLLAGPWYRPTGARETVDPPPAQAGPATQQPAAPDTRGEDRGGEIDQLGLAGVTLLLLSMIAAYNRRDHGSTCRCRVHACAHY